MQPVNKTSKRRAKHLPKTLTAKECEALRRACGRSATGLRNRAIIEAMLGAGLRVSEVVSLMPADIDFEAGDIRINNGKGGRDRVIPVNHNTLLAMEPWRAHRARLGYNGRQPFFCGIRTGGAPITTRALHKTFVLLAQKAGLDKKIHPHMLRHTYATGLLEAGYTIREVQVLLGHSNVSTTMIYTHVNPEALRRKIQGPATAPTDSLQALVAALEGLSEEERAALLAALE